MHLALQSAAPTASPCSFDRTSIDDGGALVEVLGRIGDAQVRLRGSVLSSQLVVMAGLRRELAGLREMTSVSELLAAAPRATCRSLGFDRALVSRVDGSFWYPLGLHVADQSSAGTSAPSDQQFRGTRFTLSASMPETEVVRRRLPVLVPSAEYNHPLYELLGGCPDAREYVAAPIVSGDVVFGVIHACRDRLPRPLTVVDRDQLQRLADGLSQLIDRLITLDRLDAARHRVRQAISALDRVSAADDAGPIWSVRKAAIEDQSRSAPAGLTPREHDVLKLLVGGGTNAEIASRLLVSEATVKSHVKNILRKFDVQNRAGAIAKYLGSGRQIGDS